MARHVEDADARKTILRELYLAFLNKDLVRLIRLHRLFAVRIGSGLSIRFMQSHNAARPCTSERYSARAVISCPLGALDARKHRNRRHYAVAKGLRKLVAIARSSVHRTGLSTARQYYILRFGHRLVFARSVFVLCHHFKASRAFALFIALDLENRYHLFAAGDLRAKLFCPGDQQLRHIGSRLRVRIHKPVLVVSCNQTDPREEFDYLVIIRD